jgi:hypothetical protein
MPAGACAGYPSAQKPKIHTLIDSAQYLGFPSLGRGSRFNGRDAIALTVLLPLTLLTVYILVKRRRPTQPGKNVGWPLVVGVWLLGGSFMAIRRVFQAAVSLVLMASSVV